MYRCNMYERTADERLESEFRFLSMSSIIDATDTLSCLAIWLSAAMKSSSNEILVWCPDKDTDNFFILKTSRN